MSISNEEKQRIMNDLAQGNPELPIQASASLSGAETQINPQDYQNFDDFAGRSSGKETQPGLASSSLKEQIATEIKQAKAAGQLRADRIREIVQSAVSQVTTEVKAGSSDIRSIVKDAVLAVSENLQGKGDEIKEEVTAAIEGMIDGISSWRRRAIAKSQSEVKKLQATVDAEEEQLQQEIDKILTDVKEVGQNTPPNIKASIESSINNLKNSEEVALMQKRYAQLQAQLAILRANIAARYGGRYEEVKEHLDDAKTWYGKTRTQVEPLAEQATQQKEQLEEKLGNAGTALAKKERQIRQLLSDLLRTAAEALREKEPPHK